LEGPRFSVVQVRRTVWHRSLSGRTRGNALNEPHERLVVQFLELLGALICCRPCVFASAPGLLLRPWPKLALLHVPAWGYPRRLCPEDKPLVECGPRTSAPLSHSPARPSPGRFPSTSARYNARGQSQPTTGKRRLSGHQRVQVWSSFCKKRRAVTCGCTSTPRRCVNVRRRNLSLTWEPTFWAPNRKRNRSIKPSTSIVPLLWFLARLAAPVGPAMRSRDFGVSIVIGRTVARGRATSVPCSGLPVTPALGLRSGGRYYWCRFTWVAVAPLPVLSGRPAICCCSGGRLLFLARVLLGSPRRLLRRRELRLRRSRQGVLPAATERRRVLFTPLGDHDHQSVRSRTCTTRRC